MQMKSNPMHGYIKHVLMPPEGSVHTGRLIFTAKMPEGAVVPEPCHVEVTLSNEEIIELFIRQTNLMDSFLREHKITVPGDGVLLSHGSFIIQRKDEEFHHD